MGAFLLLLIGWDRYAEMRSISQTIDTVVAAVFPICRLLIVNPASIPVSGTTSSRTMYRSRRLFFLKNHRLTHAVAPPFRKKSRSAHLLVCKRPRDGSLPLPTFCGFKSSSAFYAGIFFATCWQLRASTCRRVVEVLLFRSFSLASNFLLFGHSGIKSIDFYTNMH